MSSSSDEEGGGIERVFQVLIKRGSTGPMRARKNSDTKDCTIPRTPPRIPLFGLRTAPLGTMSLPPCTGPGGTTVRRSSEGRPWEFLTSTLSPGCKTTHRRTEIHSGVCCKTGIRRWRGDAIRYGQWMFLCTQNSTTGMKHLDKARGSTIYQFQYQFPHELFHLRNQFLCRLCTQTPDPDGFYPMASFFPFP